MRKSCRLFGLEPEYFWFIVFLPLSLLFPFGTPISLRCQKQLVWLNRTGPVTIKGKHYPRQIQRTWHASKEFKFSLLLRPPLHWTRCFGREKLYYLHFSNTSLLVERERGSCWTWIMEFVLNEKKNYLSRWRKERGGRTLCNYCGDVARTFPLYTYFLQTYYNKREMSFFHSHV